MEYKVTHHPERRHFETTVEGYTGYVEYRREGDSIEITHTIVPTQIEGRGVASSLVKAAYDYAREKGLSVIPSCSYALAWSRRHPEYAEVTA